jgi:hypothetical protein
MEEFLMSYDGMAGFKAALDDVSGLLGSVSDGEWSYPSAAAGWTRSTLCEVRK